MKIQRNGQYQPSNSEKKKPEEAKSYLFGQMGCADIRWLMDMLVYRFIDAMTSIHQIKPLINR